MKLLTIKTAIEEGYFLLGHRSLRIKIYNGEMYKYGIYSGNDYILAVNLGTKKMPRWGIEKEEIENWIERKAKVNKE